MGSVERRILENIRKREEDSELQVYSTEPPGAMGEDGPQREDESDDEYARRLAKASTKGMAALQKKGGLDALKKEDSVEEDGDGWISLEEMEQQCEGCAKRMREMKMKRIKRKHAKECMGAYGGGKKTDEE